MHTKSLVVIPALLFAFGAVAQSVRPMYAIYGTKVTGPNGVIRTVNVGVIPGGDPFFCQHQINTFQKKMASMKTPKELELIKSECVYSVPDSMFGITNDAPIPNAYVTKVDANGAPIYAAWYGLPTSDPRAMCQRLLDNLRATFPSPSILVRCQVPL